MSIFRPYFTIFGLIITILCRSNCPLNLIVSLITTPPPIFSHFGFWRRYSFIGYSFPLRDCALICFSLFLHQKKKFATVFFFYTFSLFLCICAILFAECSTAMMGMICVQSVCCYHNLKKQN